MVVSRYFAGKNKLVGEFGTDPIHIWYAFRIIQAETLIIVLTHIK